MGHRERNKELRGQVRWVRGKEQKNRGGGEDGSEGKNKRTEGGREDGSEGKNKRTEGTGKMGQRERIKELRA